MRMNLFIACFAEESQKYQTEHIEGRHESGQT